MSFIASLPQRLALYVGRNVVTPLRQMRPSERLLCLAVGVVGGMFPVPMLTSVVTWLIAGLFALLGPATKLSPAALAVATAVNLLIAPVDIAAIPTLAQWGALVTGADARDFTAEFLMAKMAEGARPLLMGAANMFLSACLAWAAIGGIALAAVATAVAVRGKKKLHVDG